MVMAWDRPQGLGHGIGLGHTIGHGIDLGHGIGFGDGWDRVGA